VPRAALIAAALATARGVRWSSIAAWSSVSLVAVAGVIALVEHSAHGAHSGRSTPGAGAAVVAPAARSPALAPPGGAQPSLAAADATAGPTPDATSASVLPEGTHAAHRVSVAPRADRLREEADAIDAARELLTLGDAAGALVQLEAYQRRFAGGALREEALLLRIEALVRAGDRTTASAVARHFLKVYPASVHVDRVAALLGGLPEPQAK
jgi:hypothetical protein